MGRSVDRSEGVGRAPGVGTGVDWLAGVWVVTTLGAGDAGLGIWVGLGAGIAVGRLCIAPVLDAGVDAAGVGVGLGLEETDRLRRGLESGVWAEL